MMQDKIKPEKSLTFRLYSTCTYTVVGCGAKPYKIEGRRWEGGERERGRGVEGKKQGSRLGIGWVV